MRRSVLAAFAITSIGLISVILIALLAPWLGMGRQEEFVLYRAFGWTRRGFLVVGCIVALAPLAVASAGWWWGDLSAARRYFPAVTRTPQFLWRQVKNGARFIVSAFLDLMRMPLQTFLLIGAFTVLAFIVSLGVVEWYVRVIVAPVDLYAKVPPGGFVRFHPYFDNLSEGPLDKDGVWWDSVRKRNIPYHLKSNDLGFRINFELETTTLYNKAPEERVVLLLGGSAVFGIGATSNDTTIDAYLQRKLNEGQSAIHYTVLNMGVNGWIAYQEMILLNLYGLNLQPDWVIFMDGNNDMINIVANDLLKHLIKEDVQSDIGSPLVTPVIRNIVDGYYYRRLKPEFFRSEWENELIGRSAAYRYFTGKEYVPHTQQTRFPTVRGWKQIDGTVDFYLRAQRSAFLQCPTCRYIFSTQPYFSRGKTTMDADARAKLKGEFPDLKFTSELFRNPRFEDIIMLYTLGRVKDEMPTICRDLGSRCQYKAIDELFSTDAEKEKYFIDTVHLLDAGNEQVADYYAQMILGSEK
jgi:hypothetical protein